METVELPPFTVTPSAVEKIAELGGLVLIDLVQGGCCGTAYTYSTPAAQDALPSTVSRFGCSGAWLCVSAEALAVLPGATLDFGSRLRPPRFRVLRNPNTPEVCPCRRSFGKPWPGPRQPTCRSYLPMPWDGEFDPPAAWQRQTGYSGRHLDQ
ncbi:HesB/IscA family protein [Brachybacterium tyrofermentans]|uniref:HesB/IscA family protein n=1 Tax=Brachybacterium tyrofermentans TaxID=47848 RepID=UPI003F916837